MRRSFAGTLWRSPFEGAEPPLFSQDAHRERPPRRQAPGGQVWLADSRIYVAGVEDMRACGERVRRVFGVYSVSPAWELPKEFEVIAAKCVENDAPALRLVQGLRPPLGQALSHELHGDRHRDRRPRAGGQFQIARGRPSPRTPPQRRDPRPRLRLRRGMEGRGRHAMGTGGKAALLLSGGIDSPVAGYQLMKRGVHHLRHPLPEPALHRRTGAGQGIAAGQNTGANTKTACASTSCPLPRCRRRSTKNAPRALARSSPAAS